MSTIREIQLLEAQLSIGVVRFPVSCAIGQNGDDSLGIRHFEVVPQGAIAENILPADAKQNAKTLGKPILKLTYKNPNSNRYLIYWRRNAPITGYRG